MSFIMQLDTPAFLGLIKKAQEKDIEDKLWEKWLVELPHMQDKFIPFNEYKDKHFKQQENQQSDGEILEEAENILKMMSRPE